VPYDAIFGTENEVLIAKNVFFSDDSLIVLDG
jgi:hypothetical protein